MRSFLVDLLLGAFIGFLMFLFIEYVFFLATWGTLGKLFGIVSLFAGLTGVLHLALFRKK